jgi:predicted Zn-dependent protease
MRPVLIIFLCLVAFTAAPANALFEGADEEAIGRENHRAIIARFGKMKDEKLNAYVDEVGRRVLREVRDPEFDYTFTLLDTEMINAFALPGGYVYVTRGLLAALNDEASLANVIGHEIGHVINHHSVKQMRKSLGSLLLTLGGMAVSQDVRNNAGAWVAVSQSVSQQIILGYGREFEMESDQVGMITSHDAGYDPSGMSAFLATLRRMERLTAVNYHGFMATHPDTVSRIIEADQTATFLKIRGGRNKAYRERYLAAIDGLAYGKANALGDATPYRIAVRTVAEGDTFRSLAREANGEEGLGIQIAAMNNKEVDAPLTPGALVKVIVPVKSKLLQLHEEASDEVGAGIGDGTSRGDDRKDQGTER